MSKPLHLPPAIPPVVADFLRQFAAVLTAELPGLVEGLYLRGSLATGGFRPDSSDIDLLALTAHPVEAAEFAALQTLHRAVAGWAHPFARRFEIAYLDRTSLRAYIPGQHFPTLGQGESLAWTEHSTNWVLERWMLRAAGIALFGPPPAALIDPIGDEALVAAVTARLNDWAAWTRDLDDPDWQLPRRHKFYVVETMCRALHTLATRQLGSKADATTWAAAHLPDPWRGLVIEAQNWRTDPTVDPELNPRIRAFVLWSAGEYPATLR